MLTARRADNEAHLEYQKWVCETKRKFASEEEARQSAVKCLARDPALPALYTYRCAACGCLHLTKKKNKHAVAALRNGTTIGETR